jgi:hypothetical protein
MYNSTQSSEDTASDGYSSELINTVVEMTEEGENEE